MELLGENDLRANQKLFRDASDWIEGWIRVVHEAEWHNIVEMRKAYPTADGVKLAMGVLTVFNACGNKYRLICIVNYRLGIVVFRHFLTHAEYDKQKWKR